MVHYLYNQGYSIRKIANILKLDRKTVTRRLKQARFQGMSEKPKVVSKLAPYKQYILEFINKSTKRIPYSVVLDDIIKMGYTGKRAILQEFLTKQYKELNKQKLKRDSVVRFETEPGEQMQVDWTTIRSGKKTYLCICSNTWIFTLYICLFYQ